ncbi:MAG: PASTA domain-containing protein [Firmicutes bacterium]|nr:PASTA domain-containing protein [Bacillota bacterium]
MAHLSRLTIQKRILILLFFAIFGSIILGARLIYLQIYQNNFYRAKAINQRSLAIPVDAKRGTIYDRNGIPLAVSVSANAVYAIPAQVKDKEETARLLAEILEIEYDFVLSRVSKRSAAEWIKKRVPSEVARKIIALDLPGIGVVENPERFYPYGSVAPQVLGIVGIDNQGLEGIELYYDDILRGTPGKTVFERDAAGREIPGGIQEYIPGEDGSDIVLTIDYYIQQIAQREVERAARETGSRLAVIIIMDPSTGEILANAIYPSFDLLNYQDYPLENRRNISVTDTYEPGSTFKAVTAAVALDTGVATLNTYFSDPGFINVSGWTIRCWLRGGHGSQSFVETLENSCNPFYAKLGMDIGGERFYEYLTRYNFGSKTGIDFPGEASGVVRHPSTGVPLVTWANIGFGQGLTVTPIQLLAAFGAIANEGIYSVPHYVKEIHLDGTVQGPNIPEPRPIMDPEIAKMTKDALRSVIANGSGKRAESPGYFVAGKTGTAQLVENGRYSHSKTVTSFAGFAPADDPKMAGILILWEPQGAFFGGIIAAPVFSRLVDQVMPYLGVKRVETGSRIDQANTVVIPDVLGLSPEEASKRLEQVGLKVHMIVGEGSRIEGLVPEAGVRVPRGTNVIIYTDVDYINTISDLPNPFGM